ncbi:ribosomal protein S18 [Neurospora hispaniola]|uniref:Small ribosomal subunit protein bS18m n=1 Tax=Neurospora hispaniola TaxID=588809 RepID=A0AAJ0IFG6_9PEZI|nr:ribosomal protein S18 [Neurospora hispaniola]
MSSSRQFLSSALRQCRAAGQRTAQFSTTSPAAAIRDIPTTSFQNAPRTNTNTPSPSSNNNNNNNNAGSNQYKSDMFNLLNSGAGSRGGRDSYNNGRDVDGGQRYGSNSQKVQELLQSEVTSNNYMRMMKRRWNNGDVYAPRDLSPYEMKGRNGGWVEAADVVDELGFSPLDNYRNFSLISDYITPFGRIRHSKETGLKPVNQRKIAKMVRRAIGLGIHPSVHKHPEILKNSNGRHLLPLVVPKGQKANKTKNFDGEDEN